MPSETKKSTEYILGHAPEELRRLELQSSVFGPITARLLDEAGLDEGMCVLDIGTGAGDVAMMAAERVGPSGQVVAIDRTESALAHAKDRAEAVGLDWIRFEAIDFGPDAALGSFDLVLGRFILMHQPDPTSLVRHAASHVKPGGVVAFHELGQDYDAPRSVPPIKLFDEISKAVQSAFQDANADYEVGSRLVSIFAAAGLDEPALFSETPTGPASSNLVELMARTLLTVRPGPDEDPSHAWIALAEKIRTQASASHSQLFAPRNVAAWVRLAR